MARSGESTGRAGGTPSPRSARGWRCRRRGDDAVLSAAPIQLTLTPSTACREFPEASLNAQISPAFYEPQDTSEGLFGFADVHAHFGFPRTMAGVAMAGDIFHPLGIEHALRDCSNIHGPNGILDLLGAQTGAGAHETAGYPDLPFWPRRDTATHPHTYYRWIERAYLSGLRLAVTHATGNPFLCELLRVLHADAARGDCSPQSTVRLQTEYMHALEDYVDAQAGGPGKGWLRIVTSAAQARQVIADNKLAVILGVEYSTLFDCRLGREGRCTPEFIDESLEELKELGIRAVFPHPPIRQCLRRHEAPRR